jgi:hypothetical protein
MRPISGGIAVGVHCEDTVFPDAERGRSGSQRSRRMQLDVIRPNKHENKTASREDRQ